MGSCLWCGDFSRWMKYPNRKPANVQTIIAKITRYFLCWWLYVHLRFGSFTSVSIVSSGCFSVELLWFSDWSSLSSIVENFHSKEQTFPQRILVFQFEKHRHCYSLVDCILSAMRAWTTAQPEVFVEQSK